MPKNDRCPDCGLKLNDPNHAAYTPEPSLWSVYDFVQVLRGRWRFDPSRAWDCCGISPLAAALGKPIPPQHIHHGFAPNLLWDLHVHGMKEETLRGLVLWVYVLSLNPLRQLTAEQWLEMFRRVGFTSFTETTDIVEGLPKAEAPTEVPTLYRTAAEVASGGMSWTSSRTHAELFGRRRQALDHAPVNLYRLTDVPPEAVLGVQHFEVGHERGNSWAAKARADEWVIDATDLTPELIPAPPCGCPNHWGDHGSAGLLVGRAKKGRVTHVLLQHRDDFSHEGNKWGIPGGALEPGEDDRAAAMREAVEETGMDVSAVEVIDEYRDDTHGPDWRYTTFVAVTDRKLATNTDSPETEECRWVRLDDVDTLDLHPGFAATWPEMRTRLEQSLADCAPCPRSDFFDVKTVADELAVTQAQVYTILKNGDLPAIQVGPKRVWRIERVKLEEYIERQYAATREAVDRGDVQDEDPED